MYQLCVIEIHFRTVDHMQRILFVLTLKDPGANGISPIPESVVRPLPFHSYHFPPWVIYVCVTLGVGVKSPLLRMLGHVECFVS